MSSGSREPNDVLSSLLLFESVLSSMSEGIVVSEEGGAVLLTNGAARELLELRHPLQRGTMLISEVPALADLPRTIDPESLAHHTIYLKSTSQREGRWLNVYVRPLKDRASGAAGTLFVLHDITAQRRGEEDRRALEQRMNQAQKFESLGVLAGGIAHDFNNMLAAILGNAGLLLMQVPGDSPYRPKLDSIRTAAERASELTSQLLTYSGRGTYVFEAVRVPALVEQMRHLLHAAVSKRAALQLELSENVPLIEADPSQLRQVLLNLVTNASEAIGDAVGTIFVRTGVRQPTQEELTQAYLGIDLPAAEYVFIEVEDSGRGMDAETRARVFDPFFTTKFVGRGLGLAAVLGIVRRHGGTLLLDSEVGRGTTITALFPAYLQPEYSAHSSASTAVGKGVALVVDDEEGVRLVAQEMLEAFGYSVLTAANGREGVTLFEQNADNIAVVLLDMTMPDINGDEACKAIKRIRGDASVILMSGYSEHDVPPVRPGGAAAFLQKPYGPEALLEKVREVCGAD